MKTTIIIPTINAHEPWFLKAVSSCSFADEIIVTRIEGLSAAVNEAAFKAIGDFIAVLPDDDYFLPEVNNAIKLLSDDIDVLHFPCKHQDEDGEPYGLFDVSPNVTKTENQLKNVVHGSSFIKRDSFKFLSGYRGDICMDWRLWNAALGAGMKFLYHSEPCVVFRWNNHSKLQTQAFGCMRPYMGM